ncbi:MAG: hypothetical protein ABL973_04595 [Micropepsaceae bacterium]
MMKTEMEQSVKRKPTPLRKIDLRDANAMRRELATLYREARSGHIPPTEATKLAHILEIMRRMYETSELEARLELLEHAENKS